LPAFLLALILRGPPARWRSIVWVLLPLGILALSVRWLYPFAFASGGGGRAPEVAVRAGRLNLFGHLIFLDQFRGAGFAKLFAALREYDPWISALGLLGLALAIPRRLPEKWRDLAVVLAFALPYALAAGLYARTYQRFAMPLVPYLCLLAAWAIERLTRSLPV